jgi:hypothetical protein
LEDVEGISEFNEKELTEAFDFDVEIAFTEDSALMLDFICC